MAPNTQGYWQHLSALGLLHREPQFLAGHRMPSFPAHAPLHPVSPVEIAAPPKLATGGQQARDQHLS